MRLLWLVGGVGFIALIGWLMRPEKIDRNTLPKWDGPERRRMMIQAQANQDGEQFI